MAKVILRTAAVIALAGAMAFGAAAAPANGGTGTASADAATGSSVALAGGKITLQLPPDFVNQTRKDANAKDTGVVVQLFANSVHTEVVGFSEVLTSKGDANDTSDAAFNKMAQGALSGLKTQFQNVKKTGQSQVMVSNHKFLRIDSQQEMQGKAMMGTLLMTPYQGSVITIQALTLATAVGSHDALINRILSSLVFH